MSIGRVNPACKLADQAIAGLGRVFYNLMEPALIQEALTRGEGTLGIGGALLVTTGKHTGRSAKDKLFLLFESALVAAFFNRYSVSFFHNPIMNSYFIST